MGCGASVPEKRSLSVSSPTKPTKVESFEESETGNNEDFLETPKESIIDWEWKASGIKRDACIEGNVQKFKEEEDRLQAIRINNMHARAAGEHLEPIIELEDFEDGDFHGPTKVKVVASVEADEASSCATPRI